MKVGLFCNESRSLLYALGLFSHVCAPFSDDSTTLKEVRIPACGVGRGHALAVTGIDWNAADSPEVPAEASFLRTSGSCHELIHWLIDSSGKIRQLEKAGLRVSDVRNILWNTTSTHVGWEVQGMYADPGHRADLRCINCSNQRIIAPLPAVYGTGQHDPEVETFSQRRALVSGDAQGVVRLMRYPALGKVSMAESFAHAGCVSEVRFWQNDRFPIFLSLSLSFSLSLSLSLSLARSLALSLSLGVGVCVCVCPNIYSLGVSNDRFLVSAGKSDGCVMIWKVSKHKHNKDLHHGEDDDDDDDEEEEEEEGGGRREEEVH